MPILRKRTNLGFDAYKGATVFYKIHKMDETYQGYKKIYISMKSLPPVVVHPCPGEYMYICFQISSCLKPLC